MLISKMMEKAKDCYNSSVFFQRRWYALTRQVCQYYTERMTEYIDVFTKKDIEELFKYNVKNGDIQCAKTLYSKYGNTSLLECVRCEEVKKELKNVVLSKSKPKVGKAQSSVQILETISMFLESEQYRNVEVSDQASHKLLCEFIPRLQLVMETVSGNREKTRERKERNEMATSRPKMKVKKRQLKSVIQL